ncbi:hypothetical protein E5288_WYG006966 [Bos mutus]|uniref:Uncharacterized protein n=1 Tax=Bos mutus TaxID=72004 RepID=A0A6B0QRV7_9CETA|nr:hypothetical protein [Bos mutus]
MRHGGLPSNELREPGGPRVRERRPRSPAPPSRPHSVPAAQTGPGASGEAGTRFRALRLRAVRPHLRDPGDPRGRDAPSPAPGGPGPVPKAHPRAPAPRPARTVQYALSQSHVRITFLDKFRCIFPQPLGALPAGALRKGKVTAWAAPLLAV